MSEEITKVVDLRPSSATADATPKQPPVTTTVAEGSKTTDATDLAPKEYEGFENESWVYSGSNDKGVSVPFTIRVPPEWFRLISEHIAGRRFPYKDKGDLGRHAVFHHLQRMDRTSNTGQASLHAQVMAIHRIMEEHEHNLDFLETITRMEKYVHAAVQRGDMSVAVEMVQNVCRHTAIMQPLSWRRRYQNEINRRLIPLLNGAYPVDAQILKTER